ncbi:MAG TPA: TetR family transcriptional regulator, partial [Actinotalea sp.]|nr:TetR family transcriptional regulator [Actinotalea sp.]
MHGGPWPAGPRGRRADGESTRATILTAARDEFLERGYTAASLRSIARRAEVDPALVRYWFEDGKSALFAAALMDSGINPARIAGSVAAGPVETMAARLVTAVLAAWEAPGASAAMELLLRSVTSGHDLPASLREYLMAEVFARVRPAVPGPDAALRGN